MTLLLSSAVTGQSNAMVAPANWRHRCVGVPDLRDGDDDVAVLVIMPRDEKMLR
jgi:hypothetical protein